VRTIEGVDRNAGDGIRVVLGVGAIGQVTPEAVFRTEGSGYLDARSQEGVDEVYGCAFR
jgi:hypothetical protein